MGSPATSLSPASNVAHHHSISSPCFARSHLWHITYSWCEKCCADLLACILMDHCICVALKWTLSLSVRPNLCVFFLFFVPPCVDERNLINQKKPDPRRLISYFYSVIHKQGTPSKTSKSLTFNPYHSPAIEREVKGAGAF